MPPSKSHVQIELIHKFFKLDGPGVGGCWTVFKKVQTSEREALDLDSWAVSVKLRAVIRKAMKAGNATQLCPSLSRF